MNSIQLVISNEVHDIQVKEYQGQRVVTLRDVDTLHRRSSGTAGNNFQNNKKRFLENEDYFIIKPSQKEDLPSLLIPNRGLTLLTESGYLMLVKSFTDDLAWQVQRQLIKAYFKVKQAHQEQQIPTSTEDIMIYTLQSQKEIKSEIARLQQREQEHAQQIHKLSLVVDNEVVLTKHQKSEIQQAVDRRQGELNREGYASAHFQGIYKALKNHFDVPGYGEIKRSDFDTALKIIAGWYPKKSEQPN